MQAFYLRAGIGGTNCAEAPNALIVQGPRNLPVDITINGANVRLGSTVVFKILPFDSGTQQYVTRTNSAATGSVSQYMQILVLDGHVILEPDNGEQQVLTTGETTFRCLSMPETLGVDGQANDRTVVDGCPWAPPRDITANDVAEFREIDGLTLNYPITLPVELPTETPTPTNTLAQVPPSAVPGTPTPTPTPTITLTPSDTPTPSLTFTPSETFTPSLTFTPITYTPTASDTPTVTPTDTPTETPTATPTDTATPTATETPTDTATPTATPTDACDTFVFPVTIADGDNATLIAAINAANDEVCHPGQDTINLSHAFINYQFSAADNNTDGPNALPSITSSIVIHGNGTFLVNIHTVDLRFFHVSGGGSLSLDNMTLTKGTISGYDGGAIYNGGGSLSLSHVVVTDGSASSGGGVYNGGTMSAYAVTFSYSEAQADGGALKNAGFADIRYSVFEYNSANSKGGAIYNSSGATLTMTNSTVSKNWFTDAVYNGDASMRLSFVTIFNNGNGSYSGINGTGSILVANSIIAGNTVNCAASVGLVGVGFADDSSCAGFAYIDPATLYDPANNGGPTDTNALASNSQAVEAVAICTDASGNTVSDDQRGVARPSYGPNCDAGAYEYDGGGT
jgi:predicted outer membrane repeat protein